MITINDSDCFLEIGFGRRAASSSVRATRYGARHVGHE